WEPESELAVARSFDLVADVGRQEPAIGQESAADRLAGVRRRLVGRREPQQALGAELADAIAGELDHAPAGRDPGLSGGVGHDESAGAVGQKADLTVHRRQVRIALVLVAGDHRLLAYAAVGEIVGVEALELAVEEDE